MKKIFFFLLILLSSEIKFFSQSIQLDKIKLPAGFKIEVFAKNIESARSIALGEDIVFVGSMNGKVYALKDENRDFVADKIFVIAENLIMPVGVAYYKNDLYVSEVNRILKYKDIEKNLGKKITPIVVNDSFPGDRHHGWKFIKFGPDDKLYVPVGAPCNICLSPDPRYASVMRMNPDGSGLEIFARGIRNSVGFDWNPVTKKLWFTDNGRDLMGDNIPPDELNYAPAIGMHFGYPYIHGNNIIDPEFGKEEDRNKYSKPAIELGPHVAALGMRFYTGKNFPEKYKNQIFIAEHGSWNRTVPIGYRITLVTVDKERATDYQVFAQGWLSDKNNAWGRPVDIQVYYDGSLLVSDDKANAVYRIHFEK